MTYRKNARSLCCCIAAAALLLSQSLAGINTAQAADSHAAISFAAFSDDSIPVGLLYGPGQSLWVTLAGTDEIGQVSSGGQSTHALPNPGSRPWDITIGSDQALWFSQETGNSIGRMTTSGELAEFSLGAGAHSPASVALGQDMALWLTERDGNRITRLTAAGELSGFNLPEPNSRPMGIASAPDGNLWFTEWSSYRLGKITLQGEISEYNIPNPPARPVDLLIGPDGAIWLIYNMQKTITRFDQNSETFNHYTLNTQNTSLADITLAPDNRIWYTGNYMIGSFALQDGTPVNLIEEALPSPIFSYSGRSQIIAGPNNDLFFTTANSSKVYRSEISGTTALRDLQVFITQQPPLLLAAGQFSIDAEIVNWTNAAANNVEINLTLDKNIHFVSADLPGGSCMDYGSKVQCTLPTLDAEASLPVRFNLTTSRIGSSPDSRTLILEALPAEGDYQPANNRVILFTTIQTTLDYFNDFSAGADEHWSHPQTTTPVAGLDVLGLFDNQQVNFQWGFFPPHDRVRLCFDLYVLGPWDGSQFLSTDETSIIGPDLWTSYIDNHRLLLTTFSNQDSYQQAYPADYPDSLFAYQTNAVQIGEFDDNPAVQDAHYHICYQIEHTRPDLLLVFKGFNLNEAEHEQWALDNVHVKIFYDAAIIRAYLPMLQR